MTKERYTFFITLMPEFLANCAITRLYKSVAIPENISVRDLGLQKSKRQKKYKPLKRRPLATPKKMYPALLNLK